MVGWAVKWRKTSWPFAGSAHHTADYRDPVLQLLVDLPKLIGALQLICRHAKTREHHHKQQPMPQLQTPSNGVEEHG